MPYDEGLAQRIRELLEDDARIAEKRMFGGVAFFVNGHMAVGIIRDELMVRVGPAGYEAALAAPHARAMDFTGRPMRGFVVVAPAGFEEDAELRGWLERGVAHAAAAEREPKAPAKPRAKRAHPKAAAAKPRRRAKARPKRDPKRSR
jgi:TfoX/Sxy family transcriptional regulator of competence genes